MGTSAAIAPINYPPVADANGPYEGCVGSTITLDATGSYDPDGYPLTYEWDLDNDGEYDDATGMYAYYTWNSVGTYDVGLRVTDNSGACDIYVARVIINNCGIPEFPAIALPVVAILGLALFFQRRKD
ncbi:PKD domain-containing protein [Methanolobus sediminis]|uniref:PKD domain-containing protein n=1 Tax=Methanolobus sediminis TaxID=3072978 RepID=A0AA51UNG9_9EURY|nr:PKD domain-containing protein [Methanolobus sediminis]WMW25295.1 PKD domain-containing protein [Methanolobus sediminis]